MKFLQLILAYGIALVADGQSQTPDGVRFNPDDSKIPPQLGGRCSPTERVKLLELYEGNEQCEKAVLTSLDWLKSKQNPDGSWGSSYRSGITGLSLMAYLGHCETSSSPIYGQNLQAGVAYLMDIALRNHGQFTGKLGDRTNPYEHAIATQALAEALQFPDFDAARAHGLKASVAKAVSIILNRQGKAGKGEGGWTYAAIGRDPFSPPVAAKSRQNVTDIVDLSLSIWQIQALLAAQQAGLGSDEITASLKMAAAFVQRNSNPDGSFGHSQPNFSYSRNTMTGLVALAQQVLPEGNRKASSEALELILHHQNQSPLKWELNSPLYNWFFTAQAMFNKGGTQWKTWNDACRSQLLAAQKPDGSFVNDYGNPIAGANTPIATSAAAGPDSEIYRTCLATMLLEIYFRTPPLPAPP